MNNVLRETVTLICLQLCGIKTPCNPETSMHGLRKILPAKIHLAYWFRGVVEESIGERLRKACGAADPSGWCETLKVK